MKNGILTWAVCCLMGSNCLAQEWQKPQLQLADFEAGKTVYLYNVGTGLFYTEGNAWGTQGSVGNEGLPCRFNKRTGTDDVVSLSNQSKVKGQSWLTAYFTTNGGMYVDGSASSANIYMRMVPTGEHTFRLYMSSPNATYNEQNYPGAMVGVDLFENHTRTTLSALLMDAEQPGEDVYQTEWAVVLPADYNLYQTEMKTWKAALRLAELLAEAEEKGLDVSAESAVYANTESTLAELLSATGSVTRMLAEDYVKDASADNPIDVTTLFVINPSYDNNDNEGWNGSVPTIDKLNNLQNAEFFNTNFDCYQNLENLPEGTYEVRLQGFYRAGLEGPALEAKTNGTESSVMNAVLYATTNGKTTTTKLQSIFTGAPTTALGVDGEIHNGSWYVPNTMSASAAYFAAGYYKDNSLRLTVSNGQLCIGLRKSTTIRRDWVMLDNWQLIYLGKN